MGTDVKSLVAEGPNRIHVTLIGEAMSALLDTAMLLDLSLTDTINRALQVYGYLEEQRKTGAELLIRSVPGAEIELLKIT